MKRFTPDSSSSCAGLTRASMKPGSEPQRHMDYRVSHRQTTREEARGPTRPGNDERGGGNMIACWQNGRRVMMHSSEVARLMKKPSPRGRGEGGERQSREPDEGCGCASVPLTRPLRDHPLPASGERERQRSAADAKASFTPPPIEPRSRAITKNKNWQLLAKLVMNASNASRNCHKPACRRAHRCAGGHDACYLREFETVDAVIRRDVLRALQRAGGETDEGAK